MRVSIHMSISYHITNRESCRAVHVDATHTREACKSTEREESYRRLVSAKARRMRAVAPLAPLCGFTSTAELSIPTRTVERIPKV
jgi:hypothetical protein